jgi:anti-sigma factor RsiW
MTHRFPVEPPSRMACTQFRELIPLDAAGELDTRVAGAFQRHLTACGACRAKHASFEAQRRLLRNYGADQAKTQDPDLWARLSSKIQTSGDVPPWPPMSRPG